MEKYFISKYNMITTIDIDDKHVLDSVIISKYTDEYKNHFPIHICNSDKDNVTAHTFINDMRKLCHYIIEDCSEERQRLDIDCVENTWFSDIESKAYAILTLLGD